MSLLRVSRLSDLSFDLRFVNWWLRLTRRDTWSELCLRRKDRNDMSLRLRLRLTRNDTWSDLSWRQNDRNALSLCFRLRLTLNDTWTDMS